MSAKPTRRRRSSSSASPSPAAPAAADHLQLPTLSPALRLLLLLGACLTLASYLAPSGVAQLAGKRVVITGSSQGIGEQLAYTHCAAGASVLLVARSKPRLARVAAECTRLQAGVVEGSGLTVATLSADLSDVEGCGAAVLAAAKAELGGVDILYLNHIMNSGAAYDSRGWLGGSGSDWEQQLATVRTTFDVNTFSFISLATAALPALESSSGAIVIVSSMAGKMGLPAVAVSTH